MFAIILIVLTYNFLHSLLFIFLCIWCTTVTFVLLRIMLWHANVSWPSVLFTKQKTNK